MVDVREERVEISRAIGTSHHRLVRSTICFNKELFDQILAEAKSRHWTLSHMVRHLCEASIEGIE